MDRLPDRDTVVRWFASECNLALVTGGPANLLVLDFDRFAAWIGWRRDNPKLAGTYTESSSRGAHVFLRVSKPTSSMQVDGIDVLAGRHLVMASPSIHPNGALYGPMNDGAIMSIVSLADALPDWERRVPAATREQSSFITEYSNPGATQRQDIIGQIKNRLSILAYLVRHAGVTPIPSSRDGRWFVCRCPSAGHTDVNPSFWCDARRGVCGCFKPDCKAGQPRGLPMDVINLHGWLTGQSNREAIRDLARLAGLC